MFIPDARQRIASVPQSLAPFLLAVFAVVASIVVWALVSTRTVSNEPASSAVALLSMATDVRSIAYSVPDKDADGACASGTDACFDTVYIRDFSETEGTALAQFPYRFGLRATGQAAPGGDRIAVIHVETLAESAVQGTSPLPAQLTFVTVPDGARTEAQATVDYYSPLAWSPDGSRVAAVSSVPRAEAGRSSFTVLSIDAATGAVTGSAAFGDAMQVAPVGYSLDGARLFLVVVDNAGSSLWESRGSQAQKLWTFSPGPTRDWSLSPDGARLAFVDRLGVGARSYAGRTLTIASGAVTDAATTGNQLGTAWHPGRLTADFGGPDGSLKLENPSSASDYILPLRWAPDGTMLAATVYTPAPDGTGAPVASIEIVSEARPNAPGVREPLAQQKEARFFGWVRDID